MTEVENKNTNVPGPEARQWAMFCHFAALIGLVFPFGNLLGPLIVWQMKKDTDAFVNDQGKEAVNFQITLTIALLISTLLMLVLIGILMVFVVSIVGMVLAIIAGIKANDGVSYRYPFTWRVIK